jgi:hypothetical protein
VAFDTAPEGNHLSKLGAWFSEEPLVADLFARLAGEAGRERPRPMFVYEADLSFSNPRVYPDYGALEMDLAMNPLVDGAIWSYDDYVAWAEANPEFERGPSGRCVADFRAHLRALGHDGVVVARCTRDGGLPRADYVALDSGAVRVTRVSSPAPSGLSAPTPDDLVRRMRDEAARRDALASGRGSMGGGAGDGARDGRTRGGGGMALEWRNLPRRSGWSADGGDGTRLIIAPVAGRWRLSSAPPREDGTPARPQPLWEADTVAACREVAEVVAANAAAERAFRAAERTPITRPSAAVPGVTLRIGCGGGVEALDENGENVCSFHVGFSPWEARYVVGQPSINTSSVVHSKYVHRGLGRELHDLIEDYYGLPLIPHGLNAAPGGLTDDSRAFWEKRARHRPVPGMGDPAAAGRWAEVRAMRKTFVDESSLRGSPELALLVAEATGWPLEAAFDTEDGELVKAWCLTPDGKALSARGPERRTEMLEAATGRGFTRRPVEAVVVAPEELDRLQAEHYAKCVAGGNETVFACYGRAGEKLRAEDRGEAACWLERRLAAFLPAPAPVGAPPDEPGPERRFGP